MEFKKIRPKKGGELSKGPSGPSYPRFSIDLEHLVEAKKWDLEKKYFIALELKMTGLDIQKDYGNVSFEIHGIKVLPKPKEQKAIRYK